MTKEDESSYDPENRVDCKATGAQHSWQWDKEQQSYHCDECGCTEDNQEDYDYG